MDLHWIEAAAREGRRVGVVTGQIAAAINPMECVPLVVPATVVGPADQPGMPGDAWWLELELLPGNEPLPQLYKPEEILGFWPR